MGAKVTRECQAKIASLDLAVFRDDETWNHEDGGNLTPPGVGIGEVRVLEHDARPVARQKAGIAPAERGMGDAGSVLRHGEERGPRMERHGWSPGERPSPTPARDGPTHSPTVSDP